MNKDIHMIFKQASVYMRASMDVVTSLQRVQKRVHSVSIRRSLDEVISRLMQGKRLSEAFASMARKKILDPVSLSMISSAEESGALPEVFSQIAEYIQKKIRARAALLSALMYPAGILAASFCMTYFLISSIFPKVLPLFSSMNMSLPPATRFMLVLSHHLQKHGSFAAAFLVLLFITLNLAYRRKTDFRSFVQHAFIKLPFVQSYVHARISEHLGTTLGMLISAGKTLPDALRLSSESISIMPISEAIQKIIRRVEAGHKLSSALGESGFFEEDWVDISVVAEASGSLPQACRDISYIYGERIKEQTEAFIRWSEPSALLLAAAVILAVALSVIQPMYSIIQHVNGA